MGHMVYTTFAQGDKQVAGMMQSQPEWGEVPPHWSVYFATADAAATVAQAKALGADVMIEPMDVPNVGTLAYLHDPQGALFAVIKFDPATVCPAP